MFRSRNLKPVLAIAAVGVIAGLAVACTRNHVARDAGPDFDPSICDDRISTVEPVPPALAEQGITRAVGEGEMWFIAPLLDSWGEVHHRDDKHGYRAKLPMWVGREELPAVSVDHLTGDAQAVVSLSPTTEGLPGPLPASVTFPEDGCWEIRATAGGDTAVIRLRIPATLDEQTPQATRPPQSVTTATGRRAMNTISRPGRSGASRTSSTTNPAAASEAATSSRARKRRVESEVSRAHRSEGGSSSGTKPAPH